MVKKKTIKKYYMHAIAIAITIIFMALAIFVFPRGIIRIKESFIDLYWSTLYYIDVLFELDWQTDVTINDFSIVPLTPFFGLPETWEEFVMLWDRYWEIIVTSENFEAYGVYIGELAEHLSKFLLIVGVPLYLLLSIAFQQYLNTQNNDHNNDSKALRCFKSIEDRIYVPVKTWLCEYLTFLKKNDGYWKLWIVIWMYNFNAFVIIIECIAFYLYFVTSFDFINIYRQLYKLLCDVSVMLAFLPEFSWLIFGYLIFCYSRRNIGYKVLNHHEAMNCGFINERPIVTMTCGTMGKKKTTMIADMMLLQEKMFRDKALELMLENDLKFPNFPWINVENFMRRAMKEHKVYSLATVRKTFKHLRFCFELCQSSDAELQKHIKRHLRKRYGLSYENLIFGYDYEKYGMTYDDNLKTIDIWSVIESYAKEYFIYVLKSSLIISNFSVRSDSILSDLGNLPMRDSDFYKRNSKFIEEFSRYANIIDYNALRLGKKLGEDDLKKDSFEFGVGGTTEVGKERKNNLQLQELKKKDDVANQKNDGFNDWLKMIRHSATIDYVPFVKFFTDEQRPESWGADARDLCEIIHIRESGETKLALPFFAVEELVYSLLYDKFVGTYLQYRYVRGDNTLLIYLFKKVVAKMQHYYKNIYNLFGYSKLKLQVESGTQDGELADKVYYLDNKRIYSDRFSTDCFSDFFYTKSLRSPVGIEDLDEYQSSKATLDELKMQNSYFVADLINKQENDK